jgi:alpha-L-fucosidase 2
MKFCLRSRWIARPSSHKPVRAFLLSALVLAAACTPPGYKDRSPGPRHDLVFNELAPTWDEGIPLGNGMVGALVWKKGKALRLSLDRADLWDLRPVAEFSGSEFRFAWVKKQVLKRDYDPVHKMGDIPYDRDPAPTKIPAASLEFDISGLGEVESVRLSVADAICRVKWKNGAKLTAFVHATEPVGWFQFEGLRGTSRPKLVPPAYAGPVPDSDAEKNSLTGKTLAGLGYPAPELSGDETSVRYHQEGWGGMSYDAAVAWHLPDGGALTGVWSISSQYPEKEGGAAGAGPPQFAPQSVADALKRSLVRDLESHKAWWTAYWAKSTVEIPDPVLEKQWYLETYKFGAASRRGAPPITLQAVWTADNGSLPPWKGDFHNDLNTQLSYWPCYSGNRLEEGLAFLDWLWAVKPRCEDYTKLYFGVDGLNVPGVATLDGSPMGGWIQYSLGPTVSAWLAHHFYLHWRFSGDREFLEDRAYPYLKAVAVFLDQISERRADGKRKLPLSSSPEINDNRIDAWFAETTNFDLALVRWLYGAAAVMAGELGLAEEAARWRGILEEWPELALAEDDGRLLVAPGYPLKGSHRHFSHLMAIHPLGLLSWGGGEAVRRTIRASLADLDRLGPDWWCGYSYSWLGNLAARARDGEKAAGALRTFAECFCLPNSFHVNGDQTKSGKSKFTYRPFTLEGNFAFAAAVQEMLLQADEGFGLSDSGAIRVFPAVPSSWKDVSFDSLRTYGAFLVSARMKDGIVAEVRVTSEKGGKLRIENPFPEGAYKASGLTEGRVRDSGRVIEAGMLAGEELLLTGRSSGRG